MNHHDEDRQLAAVKADLVKEFTSLDARLVERQVTRITLRFLGAPVRSFVPVLVRRSARVRLRQLQ